MNSRAKQDQFNHRANQKTEKGSAVTEHLNEFFLCDCPDSSQHVRFSIQPYRRRSSIPAYCAVFDAAFATRSDTSVNSPWIIKSMMKSLARANACSEE